MRKACFIVLLVSLTASLVQAQNPVGALESPAHGGLLSGIGFISGWKCDAGTITVTIDGGGHIPAATGQPRADVRHICGTVHHGFITQMNWALLGDGEHTITAYDDGVKFASAIFTVVTTGEEFLSGVEAQCTIPDFPAPGEEAHFIWNESTQHLELATVRDTASEPLAQSKLYFITTRPPYDQDIQRTNLDGSQVETIFSSPDLVELWRLAVDPAGGKLYWTANRSDDSYIIQRANLDGSQVETVSSSPNVEFVRHLAVDPIGGKLYWTVHPGTGSRGVIWRANLDGSQAETVFSSPDEVILRQLALDPTRGKLYWTVQTTSYQHIIQRANLNGSQLETLFSSPYSVGQLTLDSTGGKLYWTSYTWTESQSTIQRADLDGSHVETVFVIPDSVGRLPLDQSEQFALDSIGGKLYWTIRADGGSRGAIQRANLDGSQVETVFVPPHVRPVTRLRRLALDSTGSKLYWAVERHVDPLYTIQRANLDGSHVETISTSSYSSQSLSFVLALK